MHLISPHPLSEISCYNKRCLGQYNTAFWTSPNNKTTTGKRRSNFHPPHNPYTICHFHTWSLFTLASLVAAMVCLSMISRIYSNNKLPPGINHTTDIISHLAKIPLERTSFPLSSSQMVVRPCVMALLHLTSQSKFRRRVAST